MDFQSESFGKLRLRPFQSKFLLKPFSTLVEDENSVKNEELEHDTEILPGTFLKVRSH